MQMFKNKNHFLPYYQWIAESMITLSMTNIQKGWTKKFTKGLAFKKIFFCIFIEIVEIELPTSNKTLLSTQLLGYYYKYPTKGVIYIFVLQLLKFWKIKFETTRPLFL
jgi:hypothetical protein